jgi:hypothetical protein
MAQKNRPLLGRRKRRRLGGQGGEPPNVEAAFVPRCHHGEYAGAEMDTWTRMRCRRNAASVKPKTNASIPLFGSKRRRAAAASESGDLLGNFR